MTTDFNSDAITPDAIDADSSCGEPIDRPLTDAASTPRPSETQVDTDGRGVPPTGGQLDADTEHAHKEKMLRRDEAFEQRKARATREKGLLIVHTGAGKGKTTAALGLAFRALGQGMKVGIVQFIKGAIATGEAELVKTLKLPIEMHTLGEGFTWKTQNLERDIAAARRGWDKAVELLRDPSFDLVILDELNIVLRYDYLPLDEVLGELSAKREKLHVVVTGRNAKPGLIEMADLVTEMMQVKHPYRDGIKPQRGIEF
jgi:cob(I)alamin adenosyltransferase